MLHDIWQECWYGDVHKKQNGGDSSGRWPSTLSKRTTFSSYTHIDRGKKDKNFKLQVIQPSTRVSLFTTVFPPQTDEFSIFFLSTNFSVNDNDLILRITQKMRPEFFYMGHHRTCVTKSCKIYDHLATLDVWNWVFPQFPLEPFNEWINPSPKESDYEYEW